MGGKIRFGPHNATTSAINRIRYLRNTNALSLNWVTSVNSEIWAEARWQDPLISQYCYLLNQLFKMGSLIRTVRLKFNHTYQQICLLVSVSLSFILHTKERTALLPVHEGTSSTTPTSWSISNLFRYTLKRQLHCIFSPLLNTEPNTRTHST